MPVNVSISLDFGYPAATEDTPLAEISNESLFMWNLGGKEVESYELVWRTSGSLQWTNYLNVGKVGNVTVDLPKDDLQFGGECGFACCCLERVSLRVMLLTRWIVRAVGKNGLKSPAVYPQPG
jgi:hypothetical protein